MKYLRNGFYLGILFLTFLTACSGATPTGPVNSKPPPFPNAAITFVPPALAPACNPPVPSITKVSSFCANPAAHLGGVTYVGPASYNWSYSSNQNCDFSSPPKIACYGPPSTTIQMQICQSCGLPAPQAAGDFVCSKGYANDGQGNCLDQNPVNGVDWYPCPTGAHYDNALQNCADDVTNKLVPQCPAGHPFYIPDFHYCLAQAVPVVYNCQTFSLPLGACNLKKIPGACSPTSCSPGYSWDQSKCSCVCQTGHC